MADEGKMEDLERDEEEADDARDDGRRSGRAKSGLTGRQAVREAREQLFELIGRPVEQVLAIERDDDGDWQVLVQVVELERIPNSTDVLGAYRLEVDERVRRQRPRVLEAHPAGLLGAESLELLVEGRYAVLRDEE